VAIKFSRIWKITSWKKQDDGSANVLTPPTAVNNYVCGSTLLYVEPHQYSMTWLSYCVKKDEYRNSCNFLEKEPVCVQAYTCYHVVSAHCNVINDLIPDN